MCLSPYFKAKILDKIIPDDILDLEREKKTKKKTNTIVLLAFWLRDEEEEEKKTYLENSQTIQSKEHFACTNDINFIRSEWKKQKKPQKTI